MKYKLSSQFIANILATMPEPVAEKPVDPKLQKLAECIARFGCAANVKALVEIIIDAKIPILEEKFLSKTPGVGMSGDKDHGVALCITLWSNNGYWSGFKLTDAKVVVESSAYLSVVPRTPEIEKIIREFIIDEKTIARLRGSSGGSAFLDYILEPIAEDANT